MAMLNSVPGEDLQNKRAPNRDLFPSQKQDRYSEVLGRLALPYRVDSRLKPTRSTYPLKSLSASTGIVSTVRDLARYDEAFNVGLLLLPQTQALAWTQNAGIPTGLGWFVQRYNGELVVWHFGFVKDAYSSLIVKVPERHLTMILLANSDGLGPQSMLTDGDLTQSLFAKVFLRFAVP
jgi:CubicO group peptidase (beta-lactamase class C family)